MRILLIGPPGVGKGTQASMLTQKTGTPAFASGDIFRAELREQTELGKLAKSYMDRGELVPDDVTIQMMLSRIDTCETHMSGFILDGFPRTVGQAEALDAILAKNGTPLDAVVSLEVDDEVVVDRLGGRWIAPISGEVYHIRNRPPKVPGKCDVSGEDLIQRDDDKPETIRERLRIFHGNTAPVVEYYEKTGLLRRIEADQSVEAVQAAILEAVK